MEGRGEWVHRAVTKGRGFPLATFIENERKMAPKKPPSLTISIPIIIKFILGCKA